MGLYLGGAILAIAVLSHAVGFDGYSQALDAGKFQLFDTNFALAHVLTSPVRPADRDHRWRDLRDGQPRVGPVDRPAHPVHPHAARGGRRR